MPLYEIVKRDGTREKVTAESFMAFDGLAKFTDQGGASGQFLLPGTWLEVWRREGVGE